MIFLGGESSRFSRDSSLQQNIPANLTRGVDTLRQMKSLKTIGIGTNPKDAFPVDQFWKRYDAGDFSQ